MQRKLALYGRGQQTFSKFKNSKHNKTIKSASKAISKQLKFTGKCHTCGKVGHKSADCYFRKDKEDISNNSDKSSHGDTCPICKKRGHTADKCWFKDKPRKGNGNRNADNNEWKGKAFITFRDGSRAEYLEEDHGLGDRQDD
jgi:hypothetical protein